MASSPQPVVTPRLNGQRVLIVQCQPPLGLALGATVARAGGHVTVARTRGAALVEIERCADGYDAAVVDAGLPGDGVLAVVQALRGGPWPCLAVGLCSSRTDDRRRAVAAGVIDLIVPPHVADAFVDVVSRCASATAQLRANLEGLDGPLDAWPQLAVRRPARRRSPHGLGGAPRSLVDPARVRRSDLESRVRAFGAGRGMSPREVSVLRYIAMGYRYEEIAEAMAIKPRTVKMHAGNVRKKAGASDRYQLMRKMYGRTV
jgi:DNA-binding NarL/FixJ family response regulator